MSDQNRELGASNSTSCAKTVQLNYLAALITQPIWVAPWPCIVTHIVGRPIVAGTNGSAVSLSFYKAPSGTAVGSGTLLHTGSYNMKGTIDTNQTLELATNSDSITLAAGDCIGYVLTGTATAAIGTVTVTVEPLA